MNTLKSTVLALVTLFSLATVPVAEGSIPADRLLTDQELVDLLDAGSNPELDGIRQLFKADPDRGLEALAAHFREAYSERYYFDWKNIESRFAYYRERFPSLEAQHRQMAEIHAGLYPAEARWKLPYRNLKGNEVSAYELRHLARQHKVLDMAFMHR